MYKTHYLKNGICLVMEKMPSAKSVSFGIFVKAGSMYETKKENGISHFIEHMLFKGTKNRTAKRIAEEMDSVGGHINAYTSRECTCYYTKVLSEDLEMSVEILSDMYHNSLFSKEDIELERGVIIEEINMYEDSPEDVALDTLLELMWAGHPLGNPIAGTEESVRGITREMLVDYYCRRYTPENTVISVAGALDYDKIVPIFEKYFNSSAAGEEICVPSPQFFSGEWSRTKDIEQAHISIAYPAPDLTQNSVEVLSVLNNILGGSMSSRLFQTVREENGLCYSVYSYTSVLPQAGMMGIYVGLSNEMVENAQRLIEEEIEKISSQEVSGEELKRALSQIKCSVIMSRESAASRMSANGKSLLLLGRVRTEEEILQKVMDVTEKDILNTAKKIFNSGSKAVFILKAK